MCKQPPLISPRAYALKEGGTGHSSRSGRAPRTRCTRSRAVTAGRLQPTQRQSQLPLEQAGARSLVLWPRRAQRGHTDTFFVPSCSVRLQ